MKTYYGVVESRDDPKQLGRLKVRIIGLHTEDKTQLPTTDLPWATVLSHDGAQSGLGHTPSFYVEGTWLLVGFFDTDRQEPYVLGGLPGIPEGRGFQARRLRCSLPQGMRDGTDDPHRSLVARIRAARRPCLPSRARRSSLDCSLHTGRTHARLHEWNLTLARPRRRTNSASTRLRSEGRPSSSATSATC